MIALLGIYIVSAFLEAFLNVKFEYFKMIFTGIGGIPYLIYYYNMSFGKNTNYTKYKLDRYI